MNLAQYLFGNLGDMFDKTPTPAIIIFELLVIAVTLVMIVLLSRVQKHIWWRYGMVLLPVFLFEFFTSPMWHNYHMGNWAYVYQDVSWILSLGWATLALTVVTAVDYWWPKLREAVRFVIYLVVLAILGVGVEALVVGLGIRAYSPEVLSVVNNHFITGLNVPWQTLYYVPVFMALVIGFYKYFSLHVKGKGMKSVDKSKLWRNAGLALLVVFLFELMVEPMALNANFPAWSYIYRDISIVMSGIWVLLIWLVTVVIDVYFAKSSLVKRFIGYLLLGGVVMLPIEAWLINYGYRVYSPSTVANFMGVVIPWFHVNVEVLIAVPIYLALMIATLRYWETILDNKL